MEKLKKFINLFREWKYEFCDLYEVSQDKLQLISSALIEKIESGELKCSVSASHVPDGRSPDWTTWYFSEWWIRGEVQNLKLSMLIKRMDSAGYSGFGRGIRQLTITQELVEEKKRKVFYSDWETYQGLAEEGLKELNNLFVEMLDEYTGKVKRDERDRERRIVQRERAERLQQESLARQQTKKMDKKVSELVESIKN